MKRIILKNIAIILAVFMVSSCEWDAPMFDSADSFIAYASSTSSVAETGGMIGIPVLVTANLSAPAVSITFEFDAASTAVEGEHFALVNPSKTLDVSDGWGYDTIWIQPIDNDVFTGNLVAMINLVSNTGGYPFGVVSTHNLTIIDNEHPLGDWIGSYEVAAVDYWSYFGPETWNVSTGPDPDDVNNLIITGIGSGFSEFTSITGVIDLEAMTITLSSGSEIGTHNDYGGPLAIYLADDAGSLYEDPIIGTINEDGTMFIDLIGIQFVGGNNAGLNWGGYATTWTPVAKKSARVMPEPDQIREIKLEL